jgi:hypothetical protein
MTPDPLEAVAAVELIDAAGALLARAAAIFEPPTALIFQAPAEAAENAARMRVLDQAGGVIYEATARTALP